MARFWDYGITQGFGPTNEPLDSPLPGGSQPFNKGNDYAAPQGTPLSFPVSGTVSVAGNDGAGWGKRVVITDAQGVQHSLGHLSEIHAQVGQHVDPSTIIGLSGGDRATAEPDEKTTGPHASYDVERDGQFIDPTPYLPGDQVAPTGGGTMQQRFQQAADQAWKVMENARTLMNNGVDDVDDMDMEDFAKLQGLWLELQKAAAGQVKDVYDLQAQYIATLNKLGMDEFTVFKGMTDTENARRISEYSAKSDEVGNKIAAGQLTLAQARDELDRWTKGKAEGLARSQFIEKTLAEAAPWATSGGKTKFTSAELGAGNATLARLAGNDPNTTGINFPSIRTVDPLADLAAQDAAAGVSGPMPGVPKLEPIAVPGAPSLTPFTGTPPALQRPGAPPDLNAMLNSNNPGEFGSVPVTSPTSPPPGGPIGAANMPPTGNRGAAIPVDWSKPVPEDPWAWAREHGYPVPAPGAPGTIPTPATQRPETQRPIPVRVGARP